MRVGVLAEFQLQHAAEREPGGKTAKATDGGPRLGVSREGRGCGRRKRKVGEGE